MTCHNLELIFVQIRESDITDLNGNQKLPTKYVIFNIIIIIITIPYLKNIDWGSLFLVRRILHNRSSSWPGVCNFLPTYVPPPPPSPEKNLRKKKSLYFVEL